MGEGRTAVVPAVAIEYREQANLYERVEVEEFSKEGGEAILAAAEAEVRAENHDDRRAQHELVRPARVGARHGGHSGRRIRRVEASLLRRRILERDVRGNDGDNIRRRGRRLREPPRGGAHGKIH